MALGTDLKLNIIYIHVVRVQICVSNSFIGLWCIVTLMLCFPVLFPCYELPQTICCSPDKSPLHLLVLFELVMVQKCFGFLFAAINHTHAQTSPSCVHSSCVVGKIVLGSRLVIALGAWKWLPTPFQSVCLWMLIKSVFALEKFSTGLTFNLLSQLHPVDGCHVPFQGCNSHLFIAHFTISTWNFSLWKCWIQGWGWWV